MLRTVMLKALMLKVIMLKAVSQNSTRVVQKVLSLIGFLGFIVGIF